MSQKNLNLSNATFIEGSASRLKPELQKVEDNFTELYATQSKVAAITGQGAAVADAGAEDVGDQLNALLASLRAAGIIAASA